MSTSKSEARANLDVDIRFLLANERTLLAWIRTSLALFVGGLALVQLAGNSLLQEATGLAVIAIGSLMTGIGYIRFQAADKAIRGGYLPEPGYGPVMQTIFVILLGVGIIATKILGLW